MAIFLASFDLKYGLIGVTFAINLIQTTLILIFSFSKQKTINLTSIYYLFQLIFLTLTPWIHYSSNILIWRANQIPEDIYLNLNLILFFTNIIILIFLIKNDSNSMSTYRSNKTKNMPGHRKGFFLLIISSISFFTLFYLNEFSILQIFFRGLQYENRSSVLESSSLSLLVGMVSRLIPVFCFLFAATQIQGIRTIKLLLFLLMLISVFPTGVARYLVAFAYIPLVLIYIPRLRNSSLFSATLLVSILFIFPFLNQFRYFSGFDNLNFLPTAEFFYAAHFDAYENFASAIEVNQVSYGWQLLGAILFFIPRVFWPEKPVGSGYELAEQLGYTFNNISMPFLGEGYVNFGIIGTFFFATFLGYLMWKLDRNFSKNKLNLEQVNYSKAIYYYLIGALFFILRGDLLSSTAFVTAGLFSAFLVSFLCRRI